MPQQTSTTHSLFLRIIATVAQSDEPMTVLDLARVRDMSADFIAQCIALHLYLERRRVAEMPIPPPVDYWVPKPTDVITRELLEPRQIR
jgi:hypothetical protein